MYNGGFFNSTTNFDTTVSENKEGQVRRLQNVVPVCVRQLLAAKGDGFVLFGMRAQILSLVCILREYEVSSTKATYQLEDHTGSITGVLWLESDGNNEVHLPPVKEGRYLKIFGTLRETEGVKTVLILKAVPVRSLNEVSTHLLEVIHARYAAENIAKPNANQTKTNNSALPNSVVYESEADQLAQNFSAIQAKVFEIFRSNKNENGVSKDRVLSNFPPSKNKEVIAAIEFLASEGHIYSTIDNDHFVATD